MLSMKKGNYNVSAARSADMTPYEKTVHYELDRLYDAMIAAEKHSDLLYKQLHRLSAPIKIATKISRNTVIELKDTFFRSIPASIASGAAGLVTAPAGPVAVFAASAFAGSVGGMIANPLNARTGQHTQLYPTRSGNTVADIQQEIHKKYKNKLKRHPILNDLYDYYRDPTFWYEFFGDTALGSMPDVVTSIATQGIGKWDASALSAATTYAPIPGVPMSFAAGIDPRTIYKKGKDTFRAIANTRTKHYAGGNLKREKLEKLWVTYQAYLPYLEENLKSTEYCKMLIRPLIAPKFNYKDEYEIKFIQINKSYNSARESIQRTVDVLHQAILKTWGDDVLACTTM